MSKSEIERMASAVGTSNSQHKQPVPWAQMNTSKEHFSPTNGEILPQNADNFAQNLNQSADNLSNANLNSPNLSEELSNANLNAPNLSNASAHFHNPRAEFSANNAYDNFANPNNPRAFISGDGANFTQNWANLKANSDPSAQNLMTNLGVNGANSSANLEANSAKKRPQNEQILANNKDQNSANLNIYNLPKKAKKSEQNINAQEGGDEHSSYADKFSQAIQDGFNYLADNHENITAFASGAGKIYHDYAGGINKAIAKGLGNLAGDYANANFPRIANALKTSSDFFAQNANLAAQSSQILKEQMERGNAYAGMAGEILFDPMLAMPAGIITKGGKGALNTLKSISAGASLGAGTSAIRDYNDDAISAQQMRQNAIINSAIWGGANGLLASKLIEQGARNLGHKIAPNKIDDYATAMAKKGGNLSAPNLSANEANLNVEGTNPHANLSAQNPRTNLNPNAQNPNLGTKNPRASQRELEGSVDFSQLEKSDFTPNFTQVNKIVGNGFVAKDGDLIFLDEAKFDLSKSLQNKSGLNERVNASLAWLQSRHPEMFKNKIAVKKVIDYVLDDPSIIKSAKNENNIFMGKMNGEKMNDIVINKDESKIIHANTRKPNAKEKADSEDALHSHSDTLPDGALMLAEKPRLSANGEILPQNADNFAQNLDQSAQNLSNANLNAPNLSNANFHNPRAEFSANNAYENFSNPNNPRFMGGGGSENPRFMPYSPSQNPRANARGQEERTGFLNGEHLGAKEASLMNGSVDFTHLKKADFPPSSSANLAFENSEDALTWRAANGANVGENLKPNGTNTARANEANQGANEAQNGANLGANEANLREGNLDANSANSHEGNQGAGGAHSEANLSATNASSANINKAPKVKLTKEQAQMKKLLKQILKAPKGAKEAFSISRGEKQTWKDAINEKLKELNKKEQISSTNKEQPSANVGENGTNSRASEAQNSTNQHENSTNQGANEANSHSTHGANSSETNLPNADETNLDANSKSANQKTDEPRAQQEAQNEQEAQAKAQQEAQNEQEHLKALLEYARSKENKARNFINSLLLRSTLGAGYGALANKDDRLKGALIGAGAGAIGIPLLRALPRNFTTTMAKNALSGGVIGATSDSDNRMRGAIVGALAGAGGVPLALKAVEAKQIYVT